jgi:hypothetical protein
MSKNNRNGIKINLYKGMERKASSLLVIVGDGRTIVSIRYAGDKTKHCRQVDKERRIAKDLLKGEKLAAEV